MEMGVPNGIMLGFVVDPDNGKERSVALHGSPSELMKVVALLGLEMHPEQKRALLNDERVPGSGPLSFSDSNGSYVTLQPVSDASKLLAMVAERSDNFPF